MAYSFTEQNEHCDWLILSHVPMIKFKCIPIGIQLSSCCPRAARDQCMTKWSSARAHVSLTFEFIFFL